MTMPMTVTTRTNEAPRVADASAATSAPVDTNKAPGDASPVNAEAVVRSSARTLTGNAIAAGFVTPPLVLGTLCLCGEAVNYATGGSVPGAAVSLLGVMTAGFGAVRWGITVGNRELKAAIAAATHGAGDAISHATGRLAVLAGTIMSGVIALDAAATERVLTHPAVVIPLVVGGLFAAAGAVKAEQDIRSATNAVIRNANG